MKKTFCLGIFPKFAPGAVENNVTGASELAGRKNLERKSLGTVPLKSCPICTSNRDFYHT